MSRYRKVKGYYTLDNILEIDANYNIILGERSNGKSFAVKYHCIEDFFNKGLKFILLRRFDYETKGRKALAIKTYFDDVNIQDLKIADEYKQKYDCIQIYGSGIYMAHEEETETSFKVKRDIQIGSVVDLSTSMSIKSMVGNQYGNIIYEEFITKGRYLDNEPSLLQDFVSTIARRRKISVWLIGNTISRMCPYFNEWQLSHIPQQKQGTIDVYDMKTKDIDENGEPIDIIVKIAVELAQHATHSVSKMFFGTKSQAIITGAWETDEYPKLPYEYEKYDTIYAVTFCLDNMKYRCELVQSKVETDKHMLAYVVPCRRITTERIIQLDFDVSPMITDKFYEVTQGDKILKQLLKKHKIVYSDNLTGQEFQNILKKFVNYHLTTV